SRFRLQQFHDPANLVSKWTIGLKRSGNGAHKIVKLAVITTHYVFARMHISSLRYGHCFDSDQLPEQRQNRTSHFGSGESHADDILVVSVRGNGLNRGGCAEKTRLRSQRSREQLNACETRI